MGDNECVYNKELVEAISETYAKCAIDTQSLILKLRMYEQCFSNDYRGQGSEVVGETLRKVKEHLELLSKCFEQTGKYVSFALADMQVADECIAREIGS